MIDSHLIHSVWTALLAVLFVGIIVWAWSARQKPRFERAARSILEDDKDSGEKNHG